ncbi:hypothetical protein ACFUJ0_11465, partial [Streptomyces sp. NPDC057242]|uniref:hypothetical protein n=1 Tax=unclassified Streptomyces TaxID=2593676 RepID=UPI003627B79D
MSLRFIGVDPESGQTGSPTAWVDENAGDIVSSFRVATDRVMGQRPATHEAPVPLREVFDVS